MAEEQDHRPRPAPFVNRFNAFVSRPTNPIAGRQDSSFLIMPIGHDLIRFEIPRRLHLLGRVGGQPAVGDAVREKGPERLQLDFPGDQTDFAGTAIILEHVEVDIAQFRNALAIAELYEQSQFGSVLPPGRIFELTPELATLIKLPVASQKPAGGLRNGAQCRSCRAGGGYRVFKSVLLVNFPDLVGESAFGKVTAASLQGLADTLAAVLAVNVKGQSHFSARISRPPGPKYPQLRR